MFEAIILGIIQGIAEWLPISSSGCIALTKQLFFESTQTFTEMNQEILFLHLGTFFAAFVYFRKDIILILTSLLKPKEHPTDWKIFIFLAVSTVISGTLGIVLIKGISDLEQSGGIAGRGTMLVIGLCLLGTGFLQLNIKKFGTRSAKDLRLIDGVILGIAQGFAALPGFSRSGLTLSTLLLRKFDQDITLRLSFLMSLPIVLVGNIVTHINDWHLSKENIVSLIIAFAFGLLTIHSLLKLAQKINFGKFIILFGLLTIISAFI